MPFFLVDVDHCEGYFGPSRLDNYVAAAADDDRPAVLDRLRHQSHMVDVIDVEEEMQFLLGKTSLHAQEAVIEGLGAGPPGGRQQGSPILRPLGPDLHPAPVVQQFRYVVAERIEHDRPLASVDSMNL